MELRHLRYFVAVADASGISRAARELHVTQPALSRQIRDLERELGVPLFDRVGRRVRLTAEGEDLLRRARDVLTSAAALTERAQAFTAGREAVLRVGSPPHGLESWLAGFIGRYRVAHPSVDVQVVENGTAQLMAALERGELHVAAAAAPVVENVNIGVRLIYPVHVLAALPPRSRLGRGTLVELTDLADQRLLMLPQGFGTRDVFDAACRLAHVRPKVVMESGSPHSLLALVEAGEGIAVISSSTRLAARRVRLAAIVHAGGSVGVWAAVLWDRRRYLSPAAQRFIDGLVAWARRKNPGWRYDRRAPALPRPPWLADPAT